MDFEATGRLLIMYSAFVQYLRKNGNTVRQCISYLQDFKNCYYSLTKEVLWNILIEVGIPMEVVRRLKICLWQRSDRQTFF